MQSISIVSFATEDEFEFSATKIIIECEDVFFDEAMLDSSYDLEISLDSLR